MLVGIPYFNVILFLIIFVRSRFKLQKFCYHGQGTYRKLLFEQRHTVCLKCSGTYGKVWFLNMGYFVHLNVLTGAELKKESKSGVSFSRRLSLGKKFVALLCLYALLIHSTKNKMLRCNSDHNIGSGAFFSLFRTYSLQGVVTM